MSLSWWLAMGSVTPAVAGLAGSQAALILIIVAAITLMMIASSRRRREGGPSPRAYAREQMARLKEEKVVHDELNALMLQLQEVAREINAQLDTKFVRLERSIRDADDRLDRLDRLLRRADRRPTLDVTIGGEDRTESGEVQAAGSSPAGELDRERIRTLAREGKSTLAIAREIGATVGAVQLVLAVLGQPDRDLPSPATT